MKVELKHQNGIYLSYSAMTEDTAYLLDNTSSENPQGPSPMELLLMGVAGCSSIDIISILNKQKIKPDSLRNTSGRRIRLKGSSSLFCLQQYAIAKVIVTGKCPQIVCFAQPNCHLKVLGSYQKH